MSSKNDATIISDPALAVHRDWCEPANCRTDRMGADNDGELEAIIHRGPEYGFITEPDPLRDWSHVTVQVEGFDNLQEPESIAIVLSGDGSIINLNLHELRHLRYLLGMAEDDLIKAMDGQEARELPDQLTGGR